MDTINRNKKNEFYQAQSQKLGLLLKKSECAAFHLHQNTQLKSKIDLSEHFCLNEQFILYVQYS